MEYTWRNFTGGRYIKLKLHRFLFAVPMLAAAAAVSAQGYIGIGYGSTSVKADLSTLGGGRIDETSTLTKFYGGYRFHRHVGVEAVYLGLASASVGQVGTGPNAVSGAVDMRALGLYGVAFVPLTKQAQVLVKLGSASWRADLSRNAATASVDDIDALFGLGLSYHFTRELAVTADWETIDSTNPEFSTISLGFKWDFQ